MHGYNNSELLTCVYYTITIQQDNIIMISECLVRVCLKAHKELHDSTIKYLFPVVGWRFEFYCPHAQK